ncbi:pyridoxamine 5'-phosphate oxidase family protein [Bacillus sp. NTK071]|uniref:pyridoxamine 5'-phosphate oxidase family protein n=1 Tax=Bacillus sp. NTK071 TaxID=2802175 RepID=UPI001A8CDAC7|nr:pyridoxamine 5'-phosphate oxidase family protein [Bacillus sp. NTK071]MBN8207893.1 pyridoxamine 5'-phosphate oxidase family protein [Bacillus sp. NTK071]
MEKERFQNQIMNEDELRDLIGKPSERAINKVITKLDENCQQFIALSPFLMMATSNSNGKCDNSPRGDAPGFVHVIDEEMLVIPERPGNKRLDSIMNILSNPQIGLVFVIPGLEETLRINGQAMVVKDEKILETMSVNGKAPLMGIAVKVEECFLHCAKAFKRSQLWDNDTWPTKDSLPRAATILKAHANLQGISEEKIEEDLIESYSKRLY